MQQRKMNRQEFGTIGVVVIAVALVAIGLFGVDLCRLHQDQKSVSRNVAYAKSTAKDKAATVNTDPYTGWETASLKYEKATFEYPSPWELKDTSWVQSDTPGVPAPWGDAATVTSPTGLSVIIDTGNEDFNNPAPGIIPLATQPIRTLGGNYHLVFYTSVGGSWSNSVLQACVASTTNPGQELGDVYINSKTQVQAAGEPGQPAQDDICIEYNSPTGEPVSAYEKNASFNDAKLIIESLKY
jgi:hypothetical protein